MVDDSTTELGSVRVGVLEDDASRVVLAGSLGAVVESLAVREHWELVPRTSGALIVLVSISNWMMISIGRNLR